MSPLRAVVSRGHIACSHRNFTAQSRWSNDTPGDFLTFLLTKAATI